MAIINDAKNLLGIKLTVEDQLKEYLLDGAEDKREEKKKQESKEKLEKIKEETEIKVAKNKKKSCETLYFETWPNKLAQAKLIQWTEHNNLDKDQEMDLGDAIKKSNEIDEKYNKVYQDVKQQFWKTIPDYRKAVYRLNPPDYVLDALALLKTIEQKAEDIFAELKKQALEMAEKIKKQQLEMLQKFKLNQDVQFNTEKIFQQLAEIPITIEEKIEGIKDLLDGLLGRYLGPLMNPNSPEFDLEILIAKMKAIVEPLLASISPIESLAGKIPIIGDIASIMAVLSASSGGGKLSKEELKKLIPKKPEIPTKPLEDAKGIFYDVMAIAGQLPMVMINVIFQMLGVIVGMFEQILGVIGVPGIPFPLSLIPDCIKMIPQITLFIWNAPQLLYAMTEGVIRDKLAEAMVLSIPVPSINMDTLKSLIPEAPKIESDTSSPKSKPETKNIDYVDVVKEKHEQLNAIDNAYSRTDVQRVLKSYKEIYDDSNEKINHWTSFLEEQHHVQGEDGKLTTKKVITPNKKSITRKKATPEDFKAKMDEAIGSINPKDKSFKYEKLKKTSSVVGGALYEKYKDDIKAKEPNEEVVITETVKPSYFKV